MVKFARWLLRILDHLVNSQIHRTCLFNQVRFVFFGKHAQKNCCFRAVAIG